MQHLQLSRGALSLTERVLRKEMPQLAVYLRNAMLATEEETIDLLLSPKQLTNLHATLEHLHGNAQIGQKSLLLRIRERWLQALCTE